MEADQPAASSESAPQKFRMNAAVARMLMICGVAMLLPVTLAVIGGSGLWKVSRAEAEAGVAVDEPFGLRQTLEAIAEEKLPPPKIEGGARRFVFEKSAAFEELVGEIEGLINRSQATAMPTDDSRTRWIVKVPAAAAAGFDEALAALKPAQLPSDPIHDKAQEVVFYEINLTRPP